MAKDKTPAPEPKVVDAKTAEGAQSDAVSAHSSATPVDVVVQKKKREPLHWALWLRVTVIVLFGLLYAWDLFEAVSNLFGKLGELARINEVRELNGFAPIGTPWVFMIANLVLPVVVFGLALLIARKRNVGILAMVLLAGLGVVAAISLSFTVFVLQAT